MLINKRDKLIERKKKFVGNKYLSKKVVNDDDDVDGDD